MKPQAALAAVAALTLTVAAGFAPAFAARSSYVIDDAHLLSQTAIAQINQQVGDFNAQTGKEVVVVTTDSLGGTVLDADRPRRLSFGTPPSTVTFDPVFFGTPQTIADELERWFVEKAADGFNLLPPHVPGAINEFVDLVVPELQRRGLFRTEYEGATLRENLGVPFPG